MAVMRMLTKPKVALQVNDYIIKQERCGFVPQVLAIESPGF
jgi:hypothetical protein